MLTTVNNVMMYLGISSPTDVITNQIASILRGVDRSVKTYLGRGRRSTTFPDWPEQASGTEYYSGTGWRDLRLNYSMVTAVASVYLDNGGYFGDGTNAFAASTLLVNGTDYALVRDDGANSAVGMLRRTAGGYGTGMSVSSDWGWWPPDQPGGTLTGRRGPCWPVGDGNIKVTYTAGYATIPEDIKLAVHQMVSFVRLGAKRGGMLLSGESLGEYSYTLAMNAINSGVAQLMDARAILGHYRDISC